MKAGGALDVRLELERVFNNRLLRTENEIREYEMALEKLLALNDVSLIGELCKGFDDDTEHHEVMFGLVHGIEYLYQNKAEEGLRLIAISVPKMLSHAKEWVEILHYRILNHPQERKNYAHVLLMLDESARNEIVKLLTDIKEAKSGKFGSYVDEVLKLTITSI
ncbi:Imm30 family immunity protein [Paenibacillus plantiphilus]|uniref:Imm30 family immunity protein n=1 Tax=Paenibacillus plantiphilus TaxID=2905650 RepID=UPI001EECC076|nr:Imm30 family immunity protein [Paenibacillus plantiphilus]